MMSADETRYWLRELRRRGWGMRVLARTMGVHKNKTSVTRKADGRDWFRGGELKRFSRQIERILAGELVCIPGKRGGIIGKTVIAEHPQPLLPPTQFKYDLRAGRLRVVERDRPQPLKLP